MSSFNLWVRDILYPNDSILGRTFASSTSKILSISSLINSLKYTISSSLFINSGENVFCNSFLSNISLAISDSPSLELVLNPTPSPKS